MIKKLPLKPVKKRALKAVINITGTQKWRETLYKIGGQELLDKGIELSKSKRGQYKKNEEQTNIYKMRNISLRLIADKKVIHKEALKPPILQQSKKL